MMKAAINEEGIWSTIADALIKAGIDVYPPATHEGECLKEYVVLKQYGSSQIVHFSSERVYYMIMLYVPRNKYSYLETFERKVKKVLDEDLYPLIMPSGSKDADYYDDNYKAHLRMFMYHNNVRNKHL